MENTIGSLAPGKFADLIILSDNPLTMNPDDLYKLSVWMTMVNGEVKYCAPGKEAYCPIVIPSEPVADIPLTTPLSIVQVKMNCDAKAAEPSHFSKDDFIQTFFKWATKTPDQLNDFMTAVQASIFLDGTSIQTNISRGDVAAMEGSDLVTIQSTFDVGNLTPGEHQIQTILSFTDKITDGYDWYGPNTNNTSIEGTCTVIIDP